MQRRRKKNMFGGTTAVCMVDVARHAGVSAQTVSRALGRPELVAEKTLAKVHESIRALGYIPNAAARNLAASSSRVVVAIIPTLSSAIYSRYISSIMSTLESKGITVVLSVSDYCQEREEHAVFSLLQYRPLGFIITGRKHTARCIELLRGSGAPVVETWDTDGHPIDMAVGYSNVKAGYDAGQLFIGRGARHTAFVGGIGTPGTSSWFRLKGLSQAVREAGCRPPLHMSYATPSSAASGASGIIKAINNTPKIQAILFSADFLAVGALCECRRRGIRVPDDIAVCGFGDNELGPLVSPRLSTVRINPEQIGHRAAEVMLDRIEGVLPPPPQSGEDKQAWTTRVIDVGHELVRRESA